MDDTDAHGKITDSGKSDCMTMVNKVRWLRYWQFGESAIGSDEDGCAFVPRAYPSTDFTQYGAGRAWTVAFMRENLPRLDRCHRVFVQVKVHGFLKPFSYLVKGSELNDS